MIELRKTGWLLAVILAITIMLRVLASMPADEASNLPAPDKDRVGFPENYRSFTIVRQATTDDDPKFITVYANEPAASVKSLDQLPYPYGSILVVEFANPAKDGTKTRQSIEIVKYNVMRREKGFGEAYGPNRTGEWEFAAYTADGKIKVPPSETGEKCAACHLKAGAERDFVYRAQLPEMTAKKD